MTVTPGWYVYVDPDETHVLTIDEGRRGWALSHPLHCTVKQTHTDCPIHAYCHDHADELRCRVDPGRYHLRPDPDTLDPATFRADLFADLTPEPVTVFITAELAPLVEAAQPAELTVPVPG